MHSGTLKKMALALTFWLALHMSSLRASPLPLGPYGTSPITFEVDANGLLSDTGTNATGTLSLSGAGTRMFWYPGKSAFRAGNVSGTDWDDANIGTDSVAFGGDNTASGLGAIAAGVNSKATNNSTVALGYNNNSTGSGAVTLGFGNTASGMAAIAIGENNTASHWGAAAIGVENSASGYNAVALGYGAAALGDVSTASGGYTVASGPASTAFGYLTTASGYYSTASGYQTAAVAEDSFVIGQYNLGLSKTGAAPSANSWISADPLFEIGNGTSTARKDAVVVYKDGSMTVQGPLTVKTASGDIPMYTGN